MADTPEDLSQDGADSGRASRSAAPWCRLAALYLISALLAIVSLRLFSPPTPEGVSASSARFSSARAYAHLERTAQEPHPRGSAALGLVRDYLCEQIGKLGLQASIQRGNLSSNPKKPPVAVENVFVRIAGTKSSKAILLCAHYDSVTTGPGAGDNGVAVAALLETLRALKQGTPLENDIIALFSDNEEYGCEGVLLFLKEHPWRKDLGVVFNFDARGVRGPSIMFETSAGNGHLIAEFAKAVPQPVATSLSMEVYRRMPNGTDFTCFAEQGCQGLNFAFIEGAEHYHRKSDTPEAVDRGTLQHTGEYMLGLSRHFGFLELPLDVAGDSVYFNALGYLFIHYPESWVSGLCLLSAVLAVLVLILFSKGSAFRWGPLSATVFVALLAALVSAGGAWLLLLERKPLAKLGLTWTWWPWLALGFALLISWAVRKLTRRFFRPLEQRLGVFLLWNGLAALSVLLPAISYIFLWPVLISWLGLLLQLWVSRTRSMGVASTWAGLFFGHLGTLSAIVLWTPLAFVLWIAFPPALTVAAFLSTLVFVPLLASE